MAAIFGAASGFPSRSCAVVAQQVAALGKITRCAPNFPVSKALYILYRETEWTIKLRPTYIRARTCAYDFSTPAQQLSQASYHRPDDLSPSLELIPPHLLKINISHPIPVPERDSSLKRVVDTPWPGHYYASLFRCYET